MVIPQTGRGMQPVIEWVNHASFVFELGELRIICDPWLTGPAFNRGWRLLSPTVFSPSDFGRISHIWFSHQHPDHFSPRDVRSISEADRARITVLYQRTIDKKIVRFCEGLRFKACVELADRAWFPLADDVSVMCGKWDDRDSWLAIRTPSETFLNLNDCVIENESQAREIAAAVGKVDVLLTQFSYANWAGNPGDDDEHRRHATVKLEQIALQVQALEPAVVIPFASFVWFSHEENFFHNAQMNRVKDVAAFIEGKLRRTAVVLYPGERWTYGTLHDSSGACARYSADFDAVLRAGAADRSGAVSVEKIESAMAAFLARVKSRNPVIRFVPGLRTSARITDLARSYELTLSGIRQIPDNAPVDVCVGSESLYFALRTPWGSNALSVNGRYTQPAGGDRRRFFRFFRAADLNDHGFIFDYAWAARQLLKRAARAAGHRRFARSSTDT